MARASGRLVMTGSKDQEFSMYVEFVGEAMPHQLRKGGYYLGAKTHRDMIEEMRKGSGLQQSTGGSTGVEGVHRPRSVSMDENVATASGDELYKRVESQSSTESRKRGGATPSFDSSRGAMDSVGAVPEASQSAVGVALQVGPGKPVRLVGRAPQRWDSSEEESVVEITEVDEYIVFDGDQSNPVSLWVLPLEFEDKELIDSGVSRSALDLFLCGTSGGLEVMRSVTAWKLTFPGDESFHILVKITDRSGAKRWVKLGKPRSGYKEMAEDVICMVRFLAFVKKEPHSSEARLRNHLLDGDVLSATFCDHLRKRRSLIELYIDLDPALEKADARKALLSLTREKVTNAGKRMLLLNDDSSDEDDYPRVKRSKTDHTRPEDVSMHEYESEEELYQDDGTSDDDDESDELGDSLCIFCDDGGFLLCCDGPCMRSFHPRPKDGINTNCKTLTFPDSADIEVTKKDWFCKNCKAKKHQCYICGELGASDDALGSKREVFVCDAASCGKFYHPRCVARKLKPTVGESEALAKSIQAGEESFTCPLHRCRKCGKGEVKKVRNLNIATCRRCPAAWHVECLPRNISFEANEESDYRVRAWELGKTFIVYCMDHKILDGLCTPKRNHIKFPTPVVPSFVKGKTPGATQIINKPQKKISAVGNEGPGFRAKAPSSAVSEIPRRSVDAVRPATQHTPEDNTHKSIVDSIVDRSKKKITLESELAKSFFPTNYARKVINWMHHGRIDSILNGARVAVEKLKQGQVEAARLTCPREEIKNIIREEEHLRGFLAPTLHGKRYTSYGRHFTKIDKLQKVVEKLQPYILDGDTIVDFSCGNNIFSRLLHDALSIAEKGKCRYKNFDIFSPKDTFGFECKDWFSVTAADCGPGDNLVIGLNPPFAHTYRFLKHALEMNPRVLVLIVPPLKEGAIIPCYEFVLNDSTTMAEKSFYLPGSVHGANDEYLEQGNTVTPHLYIFTRGTSDGPSKVKQGNTVPPSTANPSQDIQQAPKSVTPAKSKRPAPPSDPLGLPFIPPSPRKRDPGAVSARPQRMPNRVVRPQFSGSQLEEGEILPPPPPLPPHFYDDRPRQISPRFGPHPPPNHHPLDEYSPIEPGLFPPGHGSRGHFPRGHDPRSHGPRSHGPRGPQRPVWHWYNRLASGPPRYPHPGPRYPPRSHNQQFHHGPAPSGEPARPPGMPFREQDEDQSGGWLD